MTALIPPLGVPRPTPAEARYALLDITAGLHQGVSLTLDQPTYCIGTAADADLLLSDAGVAEHHLVLRLERDGVAIEARGGEVFIVGGNGRPLTVPMGRGHRARLPLTLRLGTAQLRLGNQAGRRPAPGLALRGTGQWLCAGLFMGLCAAAFGSFSLHASHADRAVPVAAAALPEPTLASAAQARQWLLERLQSTGLAAVAVQQDGRQLSAKGTLSEAQRADWNAIQQDYDRHFGQAVVLRPQVLVSAVPATPRVRFQAVFLGEHPYVIGEAGQRLYPGAPLADDWTLDRIETDQVILARGAERFSFTL